MCFVLNSLVCMCVGRHTSWLFVRSRKFPACIILAILLTSWLSFLLLVSVTQVVLCRDETRESESCLSWHSQSVSGSYWIPKTTEYYRKQPKTTENNRILPKTTEYYRKLIYPKYRKLPKTTQCWFLLMLECTEKYQSTLI